MMIEEAMTHQFTQLKYKGQQLASFDGKIEEIHSLPELPTSITLGNQLLYLYTLQPAINIFSHKATRTFLFFFFSKSYYDNLSS